MIPFTSTGLPEPAAPVLSQDEFMRSALDQPLSPMSTFFEGVKGGALESYGLGTAIRDFGNAPLADVPENQPQSMLGQAADMAINAFPPVAAYKGYRAAFQSITGLDEESPVLDKQAYERSGYSRPNIPWEPGMTEARAASLADWDDAKQVRDFYRAKRPIVSFLGGFVGQAFDPINYIPVGGEFLAARAGLGAVSRAVVGSAIDAAGNTAAAGIGTAGVREQFGDDTSWQSMVSDIAMAGLIGAGFGTIGGVLGKRASVRAEAEASARLGTLKRVQESRIALNEAIDGLVNGEGVQLSPNGLAAVDNAAAGISRTFDAHLEVADHQAKLDAFVTDAPDDVTRKARSRDDDLQGFGPYGPIYSASDFGAAIARLKEVRGGEVRGVIQRDDIGPIDLVWGNEKGGLLHILEKHPDVVDDLPNLMETLPVATRSENRIRLGDAEHQAVVRLDYDGDTKSWLVTAFRKEEGQGRRTGGRTERPNDRQGDTSSPSPAEQNIAPLGDDFEGDPFAASRAAFADANVPRERTPTAAPAANGTPRPEAAPAGLAEASARVAKPEDIRALAQQHGVDPATGDFVEQADLDQVEAEGRLTDSDRAALDEATKTFEDGDAFAKALGAAVSCVI